MQLCPTLLCVLAILVLASAGAEDPPGYCNTAPRAIPPPSGAAPGTELVLVQVLIRHGDRTVAFDKPCWANDDAKWNCSLHHAEMPLPTAQETMKSVPRLFRKVWMDNLEDFAGNCGLGQLTAEGYQQQIQNGQNLRQAYVDSTNFLPAQLNQSEMYLRADDSPRTQLSAESLVTGLYPAADTTPTQVVDLLSMAANKDWMTPNSNVCPGVEAVMTGAETTPEALKHWTEVSEPLLNDLAPVLGMATDDFIHVFDCMNTHICHNKSLPPLFTPELQKRVVAEATWNMSAAGTFPNRTASGTVLIGPLVADFWNNIVAAESGVAGAPKFVLFSGHDSTILPFLQALGVWDGVWPPYASLVAVELYSTPEIGLAVRIVYNGAELYLPGCEGQALCPIKNAAEVFESVYPTKEQCPGYPGAR